LDSLYVEYGTGERELYDLKDDPFQLANRIDDVDPALLAALENRLAALASCAADGCRRLEDLPLPEPRALPGAGLHATAQDAGVHVD